MDMKSPPNRELFGTLLSSTPAHARSWKSLTIALAIHAVLITAAIVTFKPFAPNPKADEATLNIIVVEEDDAVAELPNPFVRAVQPVAVPAAPRKPREELVLQAGPITPIVTEPGMSAAAAQDVDNEPTGRTSSGTGRLSGRLLPHTIDPRIATTTAFPPAEKTGAEAVRARISQRLSNWNDSIAADAEASRREDDWTVKGKDGNRWGVSSEGIHIGKVTIPASALAFKPPAGRREEIAGRLRDYAEIETQVYREESRSSFKERVKAIRDRKDKERAERKRAPEEKPITESR